MKFKIILFSFFKCLVIVTSLLTLNKAFAEDVQKSPMPSWVSRVDIPSLDNIPKEQIKKGVYYALVDTQVNVQVEKEPEFFYHYADHITNKIGVENNSQINLSFDPIYEDIEVHAINIIRDGNTFDKFDTARMKFIQREDELESLIYNGTTTLNIVLDDVRVGDVIEYSYSITGMNPVYDNIFSYRQSLNWSVPVGRISFRVLWNKSKPLHHRVSNSNLKLNTNVSDNRTEYIISGDQIASIEIEDNTPSSFSPWGDIYVSELGSWQEVSQWGLKLYEDVLIADDSILKLVKEIQSQHVAPSDQISAALRFVQDEIRYLGIEIGQNSHLPRTASQTLQNRYGDCKDKTVLLLTILKELGIQGHPVLVNSDSRLNSQTLPRINAFDHVIIYLEYGGKSYWFDPTRNYQYGNIDQVHQPDFGFALILREGTQELIQMAPQNEKHEVNITDQFFIGDEKVILSSVTKSHGWNAERLRHRVDNLGEDELQQEYLEFYQNYYSEVEVEEKIQLIDDKENNQITVREKYRINDFWYLNEDDQTNEADFYPNQITYLIETPDEKEREHPLYLTYPKTVNQTIELNFESDNWEFDDESYVEENDYFKFSHSVIYDKEGQNLQLNYSYSNKVDHVSPENYSEYRQALEKINDYGSYGIYKPIADQNEAKTEEKKEFSWQLAIGN